MPGVAAGPLAARALRPDGGSCFRPILVAIIVPRGGPVLRRARTIALLAGALSMPASPARGDGAVQNQVSVYTGANAVGYLQPLTNAFGAAINSSFGYSAFIPRTGTHLSLEAPVMGVMFEDGERTFRAVSEAGFQPATAVTAPTVVGSGQSVTVPGAGGTSFAFPGGLALNSFGLAVPQVRLSSWKETEAVVRWVAFETGDADIGDIELFGIGGRHSLSQYAPGQPVCDLTIGSLWQTLEVGKSASGEPFCTTDALLIQVQASKRANAGFIIFEPYAAVAWERLDVNLSYDDANGDPLIITMEADNRVRFTVGAGFDFVAGHVWGDYSFSNTGTFSFGLALGNMARAR
jgi:hypothetical protein